MNDSVPTMSEAKAKHTNREAWLLEAIELLKPLFERNGYKVPQIKVATGWPSSRGLSAKKRCLGECWAGEAAKDGVAQIFITPWYDGSEVITPAGILPTLAHEVVHAVVGYKAAHGKVFRKCAVGIGLEGKMTATYAGEKLLAELTTISEKLGPFPHAKLDALKSPKKKQGTRMVKCLCTDNDCGFTVRTSRKWLDSVGAPCCPKHGAMNFELPEEDRESDAE